MSAYHRILCARDFSAQAADALACAITLADRSGAQLDVLFADTLHRNPFDLTAPPLLPPARLRAHLRAERANAAASTTRPAKGRGPKAPPDALLDGFEDRPVHLHHVATWGEPATDAIVAYAADHAVDLVVMGTHGRRGLRRLLLGSVAESVARRLDCPVLTVHEGERLLTGPVVVAVSFTDGCDEAITAGGALAQVLGCALRLVHVVTARAAEEGRPRPTGGRGTLGAGTEEDLRTRLLERGRRQAPAGVEVHAAILYGAPGEEIAAYADEVGSSVLAVGQSRNPSPVFGGTVEFLLHAALCPVLIARAAARAVRTGARSARAALP